MKIQLWRLLGGWLGGLGALPAGGCVRGSHIHGLQGSCPLLRLAACS